MSTQVLPTPAPAPTPTPSTQNPNLQSTKSSSSDLRSTYLSQGYIILPSSSLLPPSHFSSLKSATSRVIQKTRSGEWIHRRVVGKQFPPYDNVNEDSWGVQHVMHPDLKEKAFVDWYCSDGLVDIVRELIGCEEEDLQMELFNLLINPESHEFALRWHRDDVSEKATEEEEREALKIWSYGVQWNTALYEDNCLYIVPYSHLNPRTPEQRVLSETMEAPSNPMDMPGAIQVCLKPGETVFYNNNILHCATYTSSSKRATLHGCMGSIKGGGSRARNVLQHGLEWMESKEFRDTLSERNDDSEKEKGRGRKERMLDNLIKMKKDFGGGEVQYSLKN